MGKEVFTIGHSNHSMHKFIHLLELHRIQVIYDIRSVPYSRFSHFGRERLSQNLQGIGISYVFQGDKLGGRIGDPTCYKDKVLPTRKANTAELVDYKELIRRDWFQEGIDDLLNTSQKITTAIMCSEENPARCHRNLLVARNLVERGIAVYHIRGDGCLELVSPIGTTDSTQRTLF